MSAGQVTTTFYRKTENMFFKKKDRPTITGAGGTGVGLYGKHPDAGDFLRINASSGVVRQLDEWLSAAMQVGPQLLPNWDEDFPQVSRLNFLYHNPDAGSGTALLGVMTASRDRIGRKFPLILFSHLDFSTAANCYPYIAYEGFLNSATELLMRQQNLTKDQLFAEAQQLRPPDNQSLEAARTQHTKYLQSTSWIMAFSTMLGIAAPMQQGKAVGTMRSVLGSLGGGPFPRFGIRCPLGMDPAGNSGLWLAMVYQYLQNSVVPILFWSPRSLLIYFRKSSAKALTALLSPEWQDDHLCDLSTTKSGEEHAALPGPDQALLAVLEAKP